MLATPLHGAAAGVLLGVLTILPLVGLIVLIVVDSKATNVLKINGIPVGLFGAKITPP